MSIRLKTFILSSLVFIVFFVLQYSIIGTFLRGEFFRLEDTTVRQDTGRVVEALQADIDSLNQKTPDWAQWDDAYAFIQDRNPAFIKSNLQYTSLQSLGIQTLLFIDNGGNIVYSLGYDPKIRDIAAPPPALLANIASGSALLQFTNVTDSRSGLIVLPEGVMMVSLRPIVRTDLTGPIRGTVLFGKFVQPGDIAAIAQRTHTQIAMETFPVSSMSPAFRTAAQQLSPGNPISVRPVDAKTISGYTVFKDLFGDPGILLSVTVPRDIVAEGRQTITIMFLSVLFAGVLFIVLALVILDTIVIRKVVALQRDVRSSTASGLLNVRIHELKGTDELSTLSRDINAMLAAIEEKQYKLEGERVKSLTYLDAIPFLVIILGTDQTVRYANSKALATLGFERQDILGQNWFDHFIPTDIRERIRYDFVQMMTGQKEHLEHYRYPVLTKDGSYVILDWHQTILRNNEGNITDAITLGETVKV